MMKDVLGSFSGLKKNLEAKSADEAVANCQRGSAVLV